MHYYYLKKYLYIKLCTIFIISILNFSFIPIEEKIYHKVDRHDLHSKHPIHVNHIVLVKNTNFNNKMPFF